MRQLSRSSLLADAGEFSRVQWVLPWVCHQGNSRYGWFDLGVSETASERDRLVTSHDQATDAFDRALMTLSAGSLGLSIAFVKDIAAYPTEVWALKTSWVAMAIALGLIMLSFSVSVHVHRRLIHCIDAELDFDDQPRWVQSGVMWLNWAAQAAFLVGAAFLVYFAFINV